MKNSCGMTEMCERYKVCIFYQAHHDRKDDSTLKKLLIETYCEGDLYEVCRRKAYEGDKGATPLADFAPNGFSLHSNQRVY